MSSSWRCACPICVGSLLACLFMTYMLNVVGPNDTTSVTMTISDVDSLGENYPYCSYSWQAQDLLVLWKVFFMGNPPNHPLWSTHIVGSYMFGYATTHSTSPQIISFGPLHAAVLAVPGAFTWPNDQTLTDTSGLRMYGGSSNLSSKGSSFGDQQLAGDEASNAKGWRYPRPHRRLDDKQTKWLSIHLSRWTRPRSAGQQSRTIEVTAIHQQPTVSTSHIRELTSGQQWNQLINNHEATLRQQHSFNVASWVETPMRSQRRCFLGHEALRCFSLEKLSLSFNFRGRKLMKVNWWWISMVNIAGCW